MDRRLDLDVLRTLVAIAEGGSFSLAASRVGRTQSAVSMQVRRLEEAVGKRLFDRSSRQVRLTPAGESLLGHARRMLRLEEEAWAALVEPDLRGRVQFGIPDDYAYSLLPPVLSRFAASHPQVEVELICEQTTFLDGRLANGEIDLAVITRGPGRDGELLRREPLVWFGSPDHDPHLEDPLPVALYEPGCVARGVTLEALAATQRRFRIAYSSPSLVGLMAVVRAGLAVAVVVECSLPAGMRVLGQRDGLPPLPALEIGLAWGARPRTPAVTRLAEQIHTAIGRPEAIAA
ncbi:LysR substrate-binding domain-containing protein [Inquilinus limosus]|uniref:LysR substrate-binding domain-containing protein n=1 Tax=Inquilinus limosus TaxID=171674 RepID=UPI0003F76EEA|nr:LysR substrate-binding domain-containing protein [Inquilinus limosus]